MTSDEWSIKIFECSQNLNECSLARVPKLFAVARMLAVSCQYCSRFVNTSLGLKVNVILNGA